MSKRLRPQPPKKPAARGRGDLYLSIGEDEPGEAEGDELATWTGDLLLGMSSAEAVALATDILLANRNAKGGTIQIWLPASTVRVYKPTE